MIPLIPSEVDALAGLEMGGIPLATMLSQLTGLPTLFVRKEAKTYGTCKLAEGGEYNGRKLLVVEDVVTSGGQIRNQWRNYGRAARVSSRSSVSLTVRPAVWRNSPRIISH